MANLKHRARKIHWFVWWRKISRTHTGPWRFFFSTDKISSAETSRLIAELGIEPKFEYLALPADEYPDEATYIRASKYGDDSL